MSELPALYELTSKYREALDSLADLELDAQTVADTLEGLQVPLKQKAVNVAKFFRSLESVADAIDEEAKRMAARSRAIRNRVESLRSYLLHAMQSSGVHRIESPWFVLSIANNPPAVTIVDESKIGGDYIEYVHTTRINKARIKEAILAGEEVPGAELTRSVRLAIR